jgi:hypothetical protein
LLGRQLQALTTKLRADGVRSQTPVASAGDNLPSTAKPSADARDGVWIDSRPFSVGQSIQPETVGADSLVEKNGNRGSPEWMRN